jgi:ABC-type transport system involved in multi-copper enzyme maturation permease subunit
VRTALSVELRRALSRRLVRVLIALALALTAFAGIMVFTHTRRGDPHALALVDLWPAVPGDSVLLTTFVFLFIGAFIGGASVVGAEWRFNTFTTLLTWEPRRTRVAVAKILAAALAAAVIAVVLEAVFIGALLPTIYLRGISSGADAAWLWSVVGAVLRMALITALAAALASSIAMISRSTAAALGVAFVYLAVFEAIVRAWRPNLGRWLMGENVARFITAAPLDNAPFERSTLACGLTLVGYVAILVVVAVVSFTRRDVATAS